jgi:hypothetical protein
VAEGARGERRGQNCTELSLLLDFRLGAPLAEVEMTNLKYIHFFVCFFWFFFSNTQKKNSLVLKKTNIRVRLLHADTAPDRAALAMPCALQYAQRNISP